MDTATAEQTETTTAIVKASEFTKLIGEKTALYKGLTIADFDDKAGYTAVDTARKDIKAIRVQIEKVFKADRDVLNVAVKKNLATEKEILALVTPLELELKAKTDVIDNEKQRIKDEEAAKEKARVDARFAEINKLGLTFDGIAYSYGEHTIASVDITTGSDELVESFISAVLTAKKADAEAAQRAEAERLAEQAKIAAEQKAEADRLAAEKAENERISNELKIEKERVTKELEQKEADIKAKEEKAAAELSEREAKVKAKEEALSPAKIETENTVTVKNEVENTEVANHFTARPGRIKSDKEKLIEAAEELWFNAPMPSDLTSEEAKAIVKNVEIKYRELEAFMKDEANKL